MTWFAFPGGWGVYDLNGADEKSLVATGAHGYATEAEAEAHVNASPSFLQQGLLQGLKAESVSPVGAGVSGDLATPSGSGGLGGYTGGLKWPGADTFLGRALKIVIGGVLLLAGVIKLSGAGRAIPVVASAATKLPGV